MPAFCFILREREFGERERESLKREREFRERERVWREKKRMQCSVRGREREREESGETPHTKEEREVEERGETEKKSSGTTNRPQFSSKKLILYHFTPNAISINPPPPPDFFKRFSPPAARERRSENSGVKKSPQSEKGNDPFLFQKKKCRLSEKKQKNESVGKKRSSPPPPNPPLQLFSPRSLSARSTPKLPLPPNVHRRISANKLIKINLYLFNGLSNKSDFSGGTCAKQKQTKRKQD